MVSIPLSGNTREDLEKVIRAISMLDARLEKLEKAAKPEAKK